MFLYGTNNLISFLLYTHCFLTFRKVFHTLFACFYGLINAYSHCYNHSIKILLSFLVTLFCWYERYSVLIWLYNFYELFATFVCANNTAILVNSLFGIKIVIPVPAFCLFYFILWVIVSCGSPVFVFSSFFKFKRIKNCVNNL